MSQQRLCASKHMARETVYANVVGIVKRTRAWVGFDFSAPIDPMLTGETAYAGEGEQGFVGLSTIGGGFAFARTCLLCNEADIAARYRNGRWQQAQITPGGLEGFALASSGAYWSTTGYDEQCEGAASSEEGTCSVRHGDLHFRPGRPSWATRGR